MAFDFKPGQAIRVTVEKNINREGARKTLERLFMKDKAIAKPMAVRAANFKDKPKRRGGRIWTKYTSKQHLPLVKGTAATLKVTAQTVRDLESVRTFVAVAGA